MKVFRTMQIMAILALIVALGAAPTGATTVTVNSNAGTTQTVPWIYSLATGDDHVGMAISGFFVDPLTGNTFQETIYWQNTGTASDGFGSASDGGWGVTLAGDSWSNPWVLSSNKVLNGVSLYLDYVVFDALAGNAVFDRTFGGLVGTPGSALGKDFAFISDNSPIWSGDILVTYFDQVALTGNNPVGDIYARMKVDFVSPTGGDDPFFGGAMQYYADTDVVPIPGAIVLMGSGLLGLVALGFRRRRNF